MLVYPSAWNASTALSCTPSKQENFDLLFFVGSGGYVRQVPWYSLRLYLIRSSAGIVAIARVHHGSFMPANRHADLPIGTVLPLIG